MPSTLKSQFSSSSWNDLDDDGWQDMPVIKPDSESSMGLALDDEDKKRYHYRSNAFPSASTSTADPLAANSTLGNATGRVLDVDARGTEWREKDKLDEMDYTRLELDDDPEEDDISMRTQYLFNEDKGMTPLSQMQATKTLLTEGQRIAYVGLVRLVARELVQTLAMAARGAKELEPATESARNWQMKIMGRLYRHMEVDGPEQRMIEQLAEHGVTAEDLVPSLVVTHEVENPEYDPEVERLAAEEAAERAAAEEAERAEEERLREKRAREAEELDQAMLAEDRRVAAEEEGSRVAREVAKIERRASMALDDVGAFSPTGSFKGRFGSRPTSPILPPPKSPTLLPPTSSFAASQAAHADEAGDIGAPPPPQAAAAAATNGSPRPELSLSTLDINSASADSPSTPTSTVSIAALEVEPPTPKAGEAPKSPTHQTENFLAPLPSSLPGVSTTLTAADKMITLDIRWTVLCDLFLSLIADSVYDARSRVLLGMMADRLGLEWMDVVRFERRLTEALEIQESVKSKEHSEVLEGQMKKNKKTRYMMMGLATLGGGLVIGLSAGLLAPVIGAGLGAALTTVGVSGTTTFLAGTTGSAIIASGATVTGSYIGGKAMGRRTKAVKTFDFQPLHNNKRVNFYITIPGFMSGPLDDVRLPFSTIDPVMGDVFSVLWEPEMMGDTGNALKILTSEVLTQAGQQVLAATVMTALLSALQWPMMLTKLSYLIDNPWSNALDRAKQAGAVLADILIKRSLGVRPVSLVGFSLGARVIFYALVELAKQNAFGVVQEVHLFGATVTASKKIWRQVRGIVAGRFVNAFAMNDWVLGYLFRATSGGLNTVAGLRPIEHVPDLENVDITHILAGHMSYRSLMPTLLNYVGFKTTADHFDEPEDLEMDEGIEREVVTPEEEERRRIKKESNLMNIFKKKKKKDGANSAPLSRSTSEGYDDLPPRLSGSQAGSTDSLPDRLSVSHAGRARSGSSLSVASSVAHSEDDDESIHEEAAEASTSKGKETATEAPKASPPTPPETVGFDLAALRSEVASSKPTTFAHQSEVEDDTEAPTPSATTTSFPLAPPPLATQQPLQQPTTDLTKLDAELDPRELLRRQWAGEALPGTSVPNVVVDPAEDTWGAPTPPAALGAGGFSFPSMPPPAMRAESISFGDSNGGFSSGGFDAGAAGGWGSGGSVVASGDESVGGSPALGWGASSKQGMESTASFAQQNPW